MKQTFLLVLLLGCIACNAQSYMDKLNKAAKETVDNEWIKKHPNVKVAGIIYTPDKPATLEYTQDTLFLTLTQFKFIKLGDRVYKINSPTLTEVQGNNIIYLNIDTIPSSRINNWWDGKTWF